MTAVPLLDLTPWYEGTTADRTALAATMDAHLCRLGFLLVSGHGIERAVFDRCRSAARGYFHLPPDVKARDAAAGGAYRGWIGRGLEANAATYGIDTPPDLKETFACGPVDVPDERLRRLHRRWYEGTPWPAHPADFRAAVEEWWRACRRLADDLLAMMSVALGLPLDHLGARCRATTSTGTLNWYHPRGATVPEKDQFRVGPHTDFGTVTILDREPGLGGLQVLDEEGRWIDAPWVEGALVVNTGDMLRRWTNDRWCSNEHRVLPPPAEDPTEELISLVFFHEPDHDAVIEALPTCVSADDPARHPPIRSDEYLAAKFAALAVG